MSLQKSVWIVGLSEEPSLLVCAGGHEGGERRPESQTSPVSPKIIEGALSARACHVSKVSWNHPVLQTR